MVASCGMHEALIRDRVTGATLAVLDRLIAVRWMRLLDDVSSADVTMLLEDCCSFIGDVHTWRHELVVFRDGTESWSGPIVRIEVSRTQAFIYAWDSLAYLARRAVRTDAVLEQDVSRIAERLIVDAMAAHDDTDLVANLDVRDCGIVEEHDYRPGRQTVLAAMQDLARGPIDFTALGRRIAIGGEFGLGDLPVFTDEDFAEELVVVEDGLSLCTAVVVQTRDEDEIGEAGGVDPYYGLVECVGGSGQESLTSTGSAAIAAQRALQGQTIAPRYVMTPAGSTLSPRSAKDIDRLVPGARARITSVASCIDATSTYKLSTLEVFEDALAGERISVSFSPPDALPDPFFL